MKPTINCDRRILEIERRVDPGLPTGVQVHLGRQLRVIYEPVEAAPVPEHLAGLLDRLEHALIAHGETLTAEVRSGLIALMPNLRAFAMSLTKNSARADDLMQEALLKAWRGRDSFMQGTNLEAWLFTITRNNFYSVHRKARREVEDVDDAHAAGLSTLPSQEDYLHLRDLREAIELLPADMREMMVLVALNGMSYEAAAAHTGCKLGTVKSRLCRARERLSQILGRDRPESRSTTAC